MPGDPGSFFGDRVVREDVCAAWEAGYRSGFVDGRCGDEYSDEHLTAIGVLTFVCGVGIGAAVAWKLLRVALGWL